MIKRVPVTGVKARVSRRKSYVLLNWARPIETSLPFLLIISRKEVTEKKALERKTPWKEQGEKPGRRKPGHELLVPFKED